MSQIGEEGLKKRERKTIQGLFDSKSPEMLLPCSWPLQQGRDGTSSQVEGRFVII